MTVDSSSKPIFLVTHPRACSTAFERVFLTREKDIVCVHEPFSDAYHWGPEKLSDRYEDVEKLRTEKGYKHYTYRTALKIIDDSKAQDKRVFIKDMGKCIMPTNGKEAHIVPSLRQQETPANGAHKLPRKEPEIPNVTVIPPLILAGFHFVFLIRNPQHSIPSLYECSRPPKSLLTGWHGFKAEDIGYKELRRLFDYLKCTGLIRSNSGDGFSIVDAEDLLAHPEDVVERVCVSLGISFDRAMLQWGTEEDQLRAANAFKNWAPFHDAVLKSTSLKVRPKRATTPAADMIEWTQKYGKGGAEIIRKNIEENMDHYLYLKKFAIVPN